MVIDILFFVVLGWGFYKGWKSGIIGSVFSLLAFVVGIVAALKLSYLMSDLLRNVLPGFELMPLISFVLMFILAVIGVLFLSKIVEGALKIVHLNFLNKISGAVVWIFIGLFLFSTCIWYVMKYGFITEEYAAASYTFNLVAPVSPWAMDMLGGGVPFLSDTYEAIAHLIDSFQPAAEGIVHDPAH